MNKEELNWLAGLLEGEGSFVAGPPSAPKYPRIAMQTTDEDIARRALALIGAGTISEIKPQKDHHKKSWKLMVKGQPAIHLMNRLRPLMGVRRQQQIDKALGIHGSDNRLW